MNLKANIKFKLFPLSNGIKFNTRNLKCNLKKDMLCRSCKSINKVNHLKIKINDGNNIRNVLSEVKLNINKKEKNFKNRINISMPKEKINFSIQIVKDKFKIEDLKEKIFLLKKNIEIKKMKIINKQKSNKIISNQPKIKSKLLDSLKFSIANINKANENLDSKIEEIKLELEEQRQILLNYILSILYDLRSNNIINEYPNVDNMSYEELLELEEKIGNVCKGLKQEQISKLKIEEYNKDSNIEDKCIICQYDFIKKEKIIILPCKHYFHINCIKEWLKEQKICPFCKKEIL